MDAETPASTVLPDQVAKDIRQTRIATVTIAWIVALFAVVTLIVVIVGVVETVHALNVLNSGSNCIQGVTC